MTLALIKANRDDNHRLQTVMTYLEIPAEFTPRHLRDMTATALMVATNDVDFVTRAGGWKNASIMQERCLRHNLQVNARSLREAFRIQQSAAREDQIVVRRANLL